MNAAYYNAVIPENICRIINETGLKQGAVAEKAGITERAFSDMLNGRRIIKAIEVMKISSALSTTPNDLYGLTTSSKRKKC